MQLSNKAVDRRDSLHSHRHPSTKISSETYKVSENERKNLLKQDNLGKSSLSKI